MDLHEVRKIVGKIKSHLFKNSNSFSVGMLKSHFKGSGLQFREHQVYMYGDEVRFIDWNLLAKTNAPYIKTFDEERNVEIVAVIDAGPSMFSGFENISKLQVAIEVSCLLYLLAKETGDKVHTIIVSNDVTHLPPMCGDVGIGSLINHLQKVGILTKSGSVNLHYRPLPLEKKVDKTSLVLRHLKKRHEVVLLSDFHEFMERNTLSRIINRSNVHAFRLTTPLDEADQLPYLISLFDNQNSRTNRVRQVVLKGDHQVDKLFGGKLKNLKVHDHYLECFVKEMV